MSLEIATVKPAVGAGLLIVTVAELVAPPVTAFGERAILTSVGGATDRGAETDCPARVALILAVTGDETGEVETVNVAVV